MKRRVKKGNCREGTRNVLSSTGKYGDEENEKKKAQMFSPAERETKRNMKKENQREHKRFKQ